MRKQLVRRNRTSANRSSSAVVLVAALGFLFAISAQKVTRASAPQAQMSDKAADLSGVWDYGRGHGAGQSFSLSDPNGLKAGTEDDIPYQPWAREKTKSRKNQHRIPTKRSKTRR